MLSVMAAPTLPEYDSGSRPALLAARYHLLVLGPEHAASHELPQSGSVLIGRAEESDVRVVDPLTSRHHARIHVGDGFQIEDLGSSNGTRLRDQPIPARQRLPLLPGEAVAIGSTVLVVQQRDRPLPRRRVWPHGYFETRLIETCAEAEIHKQTFSLLRIHVDAAAGIDHEDLLAGAVRPGDLLAAYGPDEYEILLVDSGRLRSEAVAGEILDGLRGKGVGARIGMAFFPEDASSPQALVAQACSRLRGGEPASSAGTGGRFVLENVAMRELYATAEKVAVGSINVLILGETGVGKEILAETVHSRSPRADRPFVCVNCAALAESLLESELFGHERGAFTGAAQAKVGLLEAASGGTLFLDEVGEMSLNLQAKVLRAIETRLVLRVGSVKPRPVDVRVVAATNRDLEEEVATGRFRQDLYFRLNGITLSVPPLRERADEIPVLARWFLHNVARQLGRPTPTVSPEAMALLQTYGWPGNIRELRNVVERALLLCSAGAIRPEHLPADKMSKPPLFRSATPTPAGTTATLRETERAAIVEALARCAGNQTRAAELLGIARRTFCAKLKEHDIPRPRL
jgi:two-component system, NtrC family, response regulator AtoC